MRVQVYRNLRKKTYSIRDAKTRRVIGYGDNLTLYNARFKVNHSGRQRALREKQKNVHATVVGDIANVPGTAALVLMRREYHEVTYNPYKYGHFYDKVTESALEWANIIAFTPHGVYAYGTNLDVAPADSILTETEVRV